ncbi:MAG: GIY-YIG nuclease family protein [Pseudomonadota bacterium]
MRSRSKRDNSPEVAEKKPVRPELVEGRAKPHELANGVLYYLLKCADDSFYCGQTDDLDFRIGHHQSGKGSDYTARRQSVELVWSQDFPTRHEALASERQIKGWSRAKKEAFIAGDWDRIRLLSRPRGS